MTTEDPEVFEVNRDVDVSIYAAGFKRMAGSPASQFSVTFLFDAQQYAKLIPVLGINLKGRATIHIVDIQAPLPDQEEEPEPKKNQPPLQVVPKGEENGRAPRKPKAHAVSGGGEAILPHAFKPDEQDGTLCRYCQLGSAHEMHAAHAGLEGAADVDLATSLIDESRRAVDPEQAAEAEAALAARSRTD